MDRTSDRGGTGIFWRSTTTLGLWCVASGEEMFDGGRRSMYCCGMRSRCEQTMVKPLVVRGGKSILEETFGGSICCRFTVEEST